MPPTVTRVNVINNQESVNQDIFESATAWFIKTKKKLNTNFMDALESLSNSKLFCLKEAWPIYLKLKIYISGFPET